MKSMAALNHMCPEEAPREWSPSHHHFGSVPAPLVPSHKRKRTHQASLGRAPSPTRGEGKVTLRYSPCPPPSQGSEQGAHLVRKEPGAAAPVPFQQPPQPALSTWARAQFREDQKYILYGNLFATEKLLWEVNQLEISESWNFKGSRSLSPRLYKNQQFTRERRLPSLSQRCRSSTKRAAGMRP